MRLTILMTTLIFCSVAMADRNIEVLPDKISENPQRNYSDQKQSNKRISAVTDSTRLKVNDALSSGSRTDAINRKLSTLEHRINGHQHELKLKTKALKTVRNNADAKIKIKSSEHRVKLRRIIGATTTSN